MIIGQAQPEMFLHPSQVFGETEHFTGQPSIALATGQVVTFDKAGVNRLAGSGGCQASLDGFWRPKDDFLGHFHNPSILPTFDHLSVKKTGRG